MGYQNFSVGLKKILAPLVKPLYKGRGQIIVLHRVLPNTNNQRIRNDGLEITPEHLNRLIVFFKSKNYDFISLDDLNNYLNTKQKRQFVIFTLDDGYVDNLIHAYPVFKKHKVPFTIYITTDFPEKKAILWWYILERVIINEQKLDFEYENENFSFQLNSDFDKQEAFSQLRHLIKSKYGEEQLRLIKAIFTQFNISLHNDVEKNALNWNQITELHSDPLVTIAAHTVSHPSLKVLTENEILFEVEQSISILESKLNSQIHHFAYPYGSALEVGSREVEILSKTNIKTSTTGRLGNIMLEHKNHLHALPRLYIGPQTDEKYLMNFIDGKIPFITGSKSRIVKT